MGNCPGLSSWLNLITTPLIKKKKNLSWLMLELDMTMDGKFKKCDIAGFEDEERRRQPKGCW